MLQNYFETKNTNVVFFKRQSCYCVFKFKYAFDFIL